MIPPKDNGDAWPMEAMSLVWDYLAQSDVNPKWMQGGGEQQDWLCGIYGVSAEIELLDLLYTFVRLLKPSLIVEGGCHLGLGSYALGRAARDNGRGIVLTSDTELIHVEKARERCEELPVEVRHCSLMELPVSEADFLFLDSSYETRIEAAHKMKRGAIAILHDSRQSPELAEGIKDLQHINFDQTWRGWSLIRG